MAAVSLEQVTTRGAPVTTYDAFISYSRRDSAFAAKLYKALSSYSPPAGLGLPERRLRVFLDRSDFTGVDYTQAVAQHLEQSAKLLVICSPNARAHAKYINDEIRLFVGARAAQHVIPVLLAGIPNNEASIGQDAELAFPQALCDALGTPLARDFRGVDESVRRIDRGRFEESWYFLLADIYQKTRAEIERRDHLRRVRNQRRLLAGSGVLVAVLAGLTTVALMQRRAAIDNAARALAQEREAIAQKAVAVEQRNLADANAALAKKNERTAEERRIEADEQRATAVDRLVRLYLSNAERRFQARDIPGALLWYVETLKLRDDNESVRIRLRSLLQSHPRLMRVLPVSSGGCDFSPDGHQIACLDGSRAARVWDLGTMAAASPVLNHSAEVASVSFSADGRMLLTTDASGSAHVWAVPAGRAIARLPLGKRIRQALFSPTGDRVVTAAVDGTMRVWRTNDGRAVTPMLPHAFPLRYVRFSPDGNRVATIVEDLTTFSTVSVWDVASGQLAAPPLKRPSNGFSVGFANRHDLLYPHISDGALQLCDAVTGTCRSTRVQPAAIDSTSFSVDGRLLLVTGADHTVRVVNVETGEQVGMEMPHGPAVRHATFGLGTGTVLTIDANNVLRTWHVVEGPQGLPVRGISNVWCLPDDTCATLADADRDANGDVQVMNAVLGRVATAPIRQSQRVREVKVSPDGKHLLVVGDTSWLWDVAAASFKELPASAGTNVWAATFSRTRDPLLLVGDTTSVGVWDASAQRLVTPPMKVQGRVEQAWFVGSRPYIVIQSHEKNWLLDVWDGQTGERVGPTLKDARPGDPIVVSDDGRKMVVYVGDRRRIWDWSSRVALSDLPTGFQAVRFTASGGCMVAASSASTLRVSDLLNGARLGPDLRDTTKVNRVAIAPECQHVATLDNDGTLKIWETRTGHFVNPRRQQEGDTFRYFIKAVFSPDGAWIATEDNDGSVRVWSVSTGAPRTAPLGYLSLIEDIAFSADGRFVMATAHKATGEIWDAATGERLYELPEIRLLADNTGIFGWSPDARHLIISGAAYIKDTHTLTSIVRVQDLVPDARSIGELATLAQLMAGRRLDESGTFVNLRPAEMAALAKRFR